MSRYGQSGNAMFLVLIAIALFAALSFSMTQGSRNAQNIEIREKNNLAASEIMGFGNAVKNSMEELTALKDIEETNANGKGLLFSHPDAATDYGSYGTQPTTEIFNPKGGRITYQTPPEGSCDGTPCSFEFTAQYAIEGMGEDNKAELAMAVPNVTEKVCKALNKISGHDWDHIPVDSTVNIEHFNGSNYADAGGQTVLNGDLNELIGQDKFCYQENAGGRRYIYVQVLHAR